MIDVLRIAHLRIAPQEGNLEVGNCEGNRMTIVDSLAFLHLSPCLIYTAPNHCKLFSNRKNDF